MRKGLFLKSLCVCLTLLAVSVSADAQSLKSLLTSVAQSVVGDKTTTASSIVGTWSYSGPKCQFESESLLAEAGGTVAAEKVESELESVYSTIGLSSCTYTFGDDDSYSSTLGKVKSSGTYTFDDDAKTITMKTKLGIKTVAYVTVTGSTMSLVFDADKLMSLLKTVAGLSSSASTALSTISTIADEYDGMKLGFELTSK